MDKKITTVTIIVITLALATGIGFWVYWQNQPSKYDDFAKCIKDSNALFYGAFWCPHCQDQKSSFGKSAKYLPYVECSTPDSNGQLEVCKKANIEVYPTWIFKNDSKAEGELSLQDLAKKTGCVLPVN